MHNGEYRNNGFHVLQDSVVFKGYFIIVGQGITVWIIIQKREDKVQPEYNFKYVKEKTFLSADGSCRLTNPQPHYIGIRRCEEEERMSGSIFAEQYRTSKRERFQM